MTIFHIMVEETVTRTVSVGACSKEQALLIFNWGEAEEVDQQVVSRIPVVIRNTATNEETPL